MKNANHSTSPPRGGGNWCRTSISPAKSRIWAAFRLTVFAVFIAGSTPAAAQYAQAQFTQVPESRIAIKKSFAPIVKKASPAVVNVYVRRKKKRRLNSIMDDPFFRRFFGSGGLPRERVQNSLGSGVIVNPAGIVVTNHHVIKGSSEGEIKVAFADKREYSARLLLKDERTDIAILKIIAPGQRFPWLEFEDSDALEVGDLVLAIGNPFGVGQTVTSGIVSALARTRVGISDYQFFIQTDAAINPGNSGGALVDTAGRLVGINTAIYSRSGGSQGIGFAIPSNMVRLVVRSAMRGTKVERPWFGAKLQNVSRSVAESLGLDRPAGALVIKVHRGSPAYRAGIKTGDAILGVDGKPVADQRAFRYRFATKGIGGKVALDVVRRGSKRQVRVSLIPAPEVPRRNDAVLNGQHPFEGARVANLSPALAEELALDEYAGVIVISVERGSSARSLGLRPNDIILRINGETIRSVSEMRDNLNYPTRSWEFSIKRNGRVLRTVVGG